MCMGWLAGCRPPVTHLPSSWSCSLPEPRVGEVTAPRPFRQQAWPRGPWGGRGGGEVVSPVLTQLQTSRPGSREGWPSGGNDTGNVG